MKGDDDDVICYACMTACICNDKDDMDEGERGVVLVQCTYRKRV